MNVIKVENLGKKYIIGHQRRRGRATFRDAMTHVAKSAWQKFRHPLSPNSEAVEQEEIWALKDVNFEVQQGERLGIIGRNGAGKSTLLKVLSRITEPTTGTIRLKGRVSSLLEVGTGFHPELTGRENVFLNGAILGMSHQEIKNKFDEIVAFADVEKFLDTPVKRYSSGMYVRLAFAVAAHLEPEILIVDEVLAVGDASFQKKCLGKMENVANEGRTVLFVSHNMSAIQNLCRSCLLIENGKIQNHGPVQNIIDAYLNREIKLSGEAIFRERYKNEKKKLIFGAILILDSNKIPTSHVDILNGMSVELEYKVLEPIISAQVTFELWNSKGVCVLCSTDFDNNPEDRLNIKQPGIYRASCFVSPQYLRPGNYWIHLGSSIPCVEVLDEVNHAISFEVLDTGSIESKLSQGRRGVISPILHWDNTYKT